MVATPVGLHRLLHLDKPVVKVTYQLQELTKPDLAELLITRLKLKPSVAGPS